MNKYRILICDDNIAIHESLTQYLQAEGYEVLSAYDGESALQIQKTQHIDLMILDIMLPHMFGTEVCCEIRKSSNLPILMLSAKGDESNRIIGLELGADDYMAKPFSPRELSLRISKLLKRNVSSPKEEKCVNYGNVSVNLDAYEVYVNGKLIEMTPREIQVLAFAIRHEGKVLSREQILNSVWGYEYLGDTRAVDTQIKRIRQKLSQALADIEIKSIYGVGYKLVMLS